MKHRPPIMFSFRDCPIALRKSFVRPSPQSSDSRRYARLLADRPKLNQMLASVDRTRQAAKERTCVFFPTGGAQTTATATADKSIRPWRRQPALPLRILKPDRPGLATGENLTGFFRQLRGAGCTTTGCGFARYNNSCITSCRERYVISADG